MSNLRPKLLAALSRALSIARNEDALDREEVQLISDHISELEAVNLPMAASDPWDFNGMPEFTGEVATPKASLLLQCSVNPNDQLVVYVTDIEHPPKDELALVMTNAQEQKISVVLTRDDAILLQNHINDFLKG